MDDAHNAEPHPSAPRFGGRRRDELTLLDIWLMIRRARWIGAFALAVGTGGGWLGGQLLGPVARRMERVDGRVTVIDSLHSMQISALRADNIVLREQVSELAEHFRLANYLTCTMMRRSDPAAVPPECNAVILDWRRSR